MYPSVGFRIKNALLVLTHSDYWVKLKKVSGEWDRVLNEVLDQYESEITSEMVEKYTLKIGGQEIWISNYPYSFGYIDSISSDKQRLPYALTRKRLKKIVDKHRNTEVDYADLFNMEK